MAEERSEGGKPPEKPKGETRKVSYTVTAAVGSKDANPASLDWRVIGTVEATTRTAAKEELLARNPKMQVDGGGEPDLQTLASDGNLWLHAEANWSPKPVAIVQPPPKFEGL